MSLVRKEKGSLHMLDHTGNEAVQDDLDRCKRLLNKTLQFDSTLSADNIARLSPAGQSSVRRALERMSNPREKLTRMHTVKV